MSMKIYIRWFLQKTDVLEASIQAATKLLHSQLYRFAVVHISIRKNMYESIFL